MYALRSSQIDLLHHQSAWNGYCINPFPSRVLDLQSSLVILPQDRKALSDVHSHQRPVPEQDQRVVDLITEVVISLAARLHWTMICILSMSTNSYLPSVWIRLKACWALGGIMKKSHNSSWFVCLGIIPGLHEHENYGVAVFSYLIIKEILGKV